MIRAALTTILLIMPCIAAHAEDFTGFYAGVNVGYARGRDRAATAADPVLGQPKAGSDLPPSARAATAAVRSSDRTTLPAANHP
jgi:hypothetical protein